jgi:alkanesulfonate monooxygenase SsuD/methylene tetrahydromethanopterin reductase-like flavin-dependent oxidoreductase (luciferase family)
MDLGIGLFTCQRRPDDGRPTSDRYEEMLRLGGVADEAGLASAWVSEHHFQRDEYLAAPLPALAALAAVTDSIRIGSCIALAPAYDGVRLAEDAATVDLLADGRLTLGLAIGSNPPEFEAFGVDPDERVDRLVDSVNLARAAWSAGPLEYDAEFHDVSPDVEVTPRPEDEIPIMFGGSARPSVRRAALTADAWCSPSHLSISDLEKRVAHIEQVRSKAGLDGDFQIYVLQYGFVGDSREEAWEVMRDGYLYQQRRYAEIFSGETVERLRPDRVEELKQRAIFGTPEQVATELEAYRDALGDDVHMILRTYHPGLGTGRMANCIRQLGDEVLPAVV